MPIRLALLKRKLLNTGAIAISYVKLIPDWLRLRKGDVVLDCGANVGLITRLLATTGATIIAFEPDPRAFKVLQRRCGHLSNVQLRNEGVWNQEATLPLFDHAQGSEEDTAFTVGSSLIAQKTNVDATKSRPVKLIDLIAFLRSQPNPVSLIKLDVEGAEIAILEKILAENAWDLFGRMYVETHETKIPEQVPALEKIRAQLRSNRIDHIKMNWI
ncbi:MAG: FkbM family methyltransferase [Bacteroidetes bacterium]|nr:FkbM family methyltransferase [Bacteroidota bacterium]